MIIVDVVPPLGLSRDEHVVGGSSGGESESTSLPIQESMRILNTEESGTKESNMIRHEKPPDERGSQLMRRIEIPDLMATKRKAGSCESNSTLS